MLDYRREMDPLPQDNLTLILNGAGTFSAAFRASFFSISAINAGFRVPVTWFMAEDFEPLSRIGDRTLSRYRSIARKTLGPDSNVHATPPDDPVRAVLGEVLEEFERTHLILRLSPRFRQKYGD